MSTSRNWPEPGRTNPDATELSRAQERMDLLTTVLDLSVEGLVVVNREGIIQLVNRSFEQIYSIAKEQALGQPVTSVVENTRLHIVAKTGVAEYDDIQQIGDRRFIVSRIPMMKDGQCVGAIGKLVVANVDQLERLISKLTSLQKQIEFLRNRGRASAGTRYSFGDIIAVSSLTQEAKNTAMRIAPTETTVLLIGESGVGKEVYAHSIHQQSLRAGGPFVRVNCSAIVESLFESELFGYSEGAFTGAKKGGKQGKFELANKGTIFLDEIADMPLEAQAKLLRVLQEQEIEKLGTEKQVKVDVRVIAATNQNLKQLVQAGRFRKDLFYRLAVVPIRIPPLRDRKEDLPELLCVFWTQLKKKHGISHKELGQDALDFLYTYDWPGNIREFHNALERSLTMVPEETITAAHLRMIMVGGRVVSDPPAAPPERLGELIERTEKHAIRTVLTRCNNNRMRAAQMLGISRALLYKKMHYYGMF